MPAESGQTYMDKHVRTTIQLALLISCCKALCSAQAVNDDPEALLNRIREKMNAYVSQLPNYTCHEVIERFARPINSGRLDHLDTVEVEVAFVGKRELFARTPTGQFEEQMITNVIPNGTIGNGAFGGHAAAVFSGNSATFTFAGAEKKGGHNTFRYDFAVPQDKSQFLVRHHPAEGFVGYKGSFWVDADSLDLVRLELKADHIPSYIGVRLVEDIMEYKPLHIRDADFLLPYKSELAAAESTGSYYLNVLKLERCREFTGESVVTFGAQKSAPSAERATPDQ